MTWNEESESNAIFIWLLPVLYGASIQNGIILVILSVIIYHKYPLNYDQSWLCYHYESRSLLLYQFWLIKLILYKCKDEFKDKPINISNFAYFNSCIWPVRTKIWPVHYRVQIPPKPQHPDVELGQVISQRRFLNLSYKIQSRKVEILV